MRQSHSTGVRHGRTSVELLVLFGVIALLAALIIPAIQQARESARRTHARNNLHEIGLALHNYHDSHGCLPPGGTVMADGRGAHGWFTQIAPYLDASPLYGQIDFRRTWNDPVNRHLFCTQYPGCLIPGEERVATAEGFALTHYSANPAAFFRNSLVRLSDLKSGTANGWLVGEAAGLYEPWGSPFNWRAWDRPLNSGEDSYGHWTGGSFFLIADGSVRFVTDEESERVRKSLTGVLPTPLPADVTRPERDWKYVTKSNVRRSTHVSLDDLEWDGLELEFWEDENESTHTAKIQPRGKWSDRNPNLNDLRQVVKTCSDAKVLLIDISIDKHVSELLMNFSRLEVLCVLTVSTEPEVLANLQRLRQLQELIVYSLEPEAAEYLTASLPAVTVDVRSSPVDF